jgi:hypothetical protein
MATTTAVTSPAIASRFRALERLIGNTPLLAIDFEFRGHRRSIYAKSEQMDLAGSIKDRMALHILRQAYAEGLVPQVRAALFGANLGILDTDFSRASVSCVLSVCSPGVSSMLRGAKGLVSLLLSPPPTRA